MQRGEIWFAATPGSAPVRRAWDRDRASSRTIDTWRSELLAYFDTGGVSNGPTAAMNSLIKKVKRVGDAGRWRVATGSTLAERGQGLPWRIAPE